MCVSSSQRRRVCVCVRVRIVSALHYPLLLSTGSRVSLSPAMRRALHSGKSCWETQFFFPPLSGTASQPAFLERVPALTLLGDSELLTPFFCLAKQAPLLRHPPLICDFFAPGVYRKNTELVQVARSAGAETLLPDVFPKGIIPAVYLFICLFLPFPPAICRIWMCAKPREESEPNAAPASEPLIGLTREMVAATTLID